MRAHDDHVAAVVARVADDFRRRIAFEEDMADANAGVDGTNLFELVAPVATSGVLVGRFAGRDNIGRVHEQHSQAGAMDFGQGDGMEVRLIGVRREIGRL